MDESMRRSDDRYYADVRAVLKRFYQPGDTMTLTRRFFEPRKCQMCGDKVDIRDCFVLRNDRTKEEIVSGKHCVVKYVIVVEQMGQTAVISCPASNKAAAAKINQLRPNTVTELSEFDASFDDDHPENYDEERERLMDMGLDPDDPDFTELAPHGMSGDEDDNEDDDDVTSRDETGGR